MSQQRRLSSREARRDLRLVVDHLPIVPPRQIRHVPAMGPVGVLQPVLSAKGIEVAARRLKVWWVTPARLVDVNAVFPWREPLSHDVDHGPTCRSLPKQRGPDEVALSIAKLRGGSSSSLAEKAGNKH